MLRCVGPGSIATVSLVLLAACGSAPPPGPEAPAPLPPDARASWVVRSSLTRERSVRRVVDEAVAAGLNTLLVQVRGRGDAYFQGGLEPPPPSLQGKDYDPLRLIVDLAHARGITVHAWVNANLVWSPEQPNPHPLHLVHRHPEWLMAPEPLARELLRLPPGHDGFRSRLESYVKQHKSSVEGVYGDPANSEYRRHLADVCADVVRRYDVDGIHLDYIRYPGPKWGYSRAGLDAFRVEIDREISAGDRRDMAGRVLKNPLVYTRRYPVRWASFRRRVVSRMVEGIATATRGIRSSIVISAAVFPDVTDARDRRFQEWTEWLRSGWIDVACPMNYATSAERSTFEQRTRAAIAARGRGRVWMGIGSWRLPIDETVSRVRFVRRVGANGVVLFSHGGLQGQAGAFGKLRRTVFGDAARE